jgi:hypothetical protein
MRFFRERSDVPGDPFATLDDISPRKEVCGRVLFIGNNVELSKQIEVSLKASNCIAERAAGSAVLCTGFGKPLSTW